MENNDRDITYINKGVSQDERLPQALLPGNIPIDDRSTVDLVAFLGEYASLLNYYSTDAQGQLVKDGDWSFFVNDPVFRLAEIANASQQQNREILDLIFSVLQDPKAGLTNQVYALRLLFEIISTWFSCINQWLHYADVVPKDFFGELTGIVKNNLAPLLVSTRGCALFYEHHAHLTKYMYFDPHQLKNFNEAYWGNLHNYNPIEAVEKNLKTMAGDSEDPEVILKQTYAVIVQAAQNIQYNHNYIISLANTSFNKQLSDRSDIKPDLGLLLTFIDLFGHAQQKINALTARHLDFYYKDTLKLQEAPLVPDSTYLVMQLMPGCDSMELPANVAFDAGKDLAGNTVIFSTTESTGLNQVQVADLRTFFVASNPAIVPEVMPETTRPFITGLYNASHSVAGLAGSSGFAVLGEDQVMFSAQQRTMQNAPLGFALSSAAFFLSGGKRTIQIDLQCTSTSFSENLLRPLNSMASQIPGVDIGNTAESLFEGLFSNAFIATATGTKGWFNINISAVSYSPQASCLSLTLSLAATDQAITAYNETLHGAAYTTPYPVINITIQQAFPYNIYNFLNNLELLTAKITTSVKELKTLSLYNQYGQIDASKPFQPLGVQPEKGSYLLIGSNELFIKNLSEIDVTINWQALPSTGDFGSYYAAYDLNPAITNDSFTMNASFLNNGTWGSPSAMTSQFSLFNTGTPGSTTLQSSSTFQLKPLDNTLTCLSIKPADLNTPLLYNQNTSAGFIRLELTAPSYGFGASLYSNALSATVLKNAAGQLEQLEPKRTGLFHRAEAVADIASSLSNYKPSPLPNQPFTPVAGSVSVDYTATDTIDFRPGTKTIPNFEPFYYIDIFTTYAVTAKATPPVATKKPAPHLLLYSEDDDAATLGSYKYLLPQYNNQGTLYIGLINVDAPESVNIFFQLSEKALGSTVANLPPITWSYLASNAWQTLIQGQTISDGTMGLIRSGIVSVNLPEDITDNNTVMPAGYYWLKVSAASELQIFSRLTAIYTQVARVVYSNAAATQRSSLILPAGTITKPVNTIAQLKAVSQPFSSTGGVVAESETAFYTRVSERLRHKQRAITPWDYERIILQNFPEVFQTKCITNSHLKDQGVAPGTANMVVIPYVNAEGTVVNNQLGPVFGFTMLENIKTFLQQYTSAHVQLNVRNPVYETLTVNCSVKFSDSSPFYIQKLNQDLQAFLSPWILGNKTARSIGEGIQKSTILGFIQKLDYVEFVTGFSVIKISEMNGKYYLYDSADEKNTGQDLLLALTPWSVFVSAETHLINAIAEVKLIQPAPLGIGSLCLSSDFIIPEEGPMLKGTQGSQNNLYFI